MKEIAGLMLIFFGIVICSTLIGFFVGIPMIHMGINLLG